MRSGPASPYPAGSGDPRPYRSRTRGSSFSRSSASAILADVRMFSAPRRFLRAFDRAGRVEVAAERVERPHQRLALVEPLDGHPPERHVRHAVGVRGERRERPAEEPRLTGIGPGRGRHLRRQPDERRADAGLLFRVEELGQREAAERQPADLKERAPRYTGARAGMAASAG